MQAYQYQKLVKHNCINFGMIISATQNYAIWIQILLSFKLKLQMFIKILQMILKKRFGILNYEFNRPLPTEKNTKAIELMKDELKEKIMTEVCCSQTKNLFLLNG